MDRINTTIPVDFIGNRIVLEKIQIGMDVDSMWLGDITLEQRVSYVSDRIIYSLRGYLLGEKTPEKIIEYPLDWWQAFKSRWFPKWALKRWPVKNRRHYIRFAIMYPNYKLALPREKQIVELWEYHADQG